MARRQRKDYSETEGKKDNRILNLNEEEIIKKNSQKEEKIKEEDSDEMEEEKIERFRKAILSSGKVISEKNRAVKSVIREWSEFIIGGILVAVFAAAVWSGIHYYTKKKAVSQITGMEMTDTKTNSEEPLNIQAYKNGEAAVKKENSVTKAAVVYKEEIATLQALTVTEASVTVPTASTGAKVFGKYYMIQLSTYRDVNKAKKDVEYMKTRGFESYYMTEDKKLYRVILNIIFTTMEDAEAFGENLKKHKYIQSFNVKIMENKIGEEKSDKQEIKKSK